MFSIGGTPWAMGVRGIIPQIFFGNFVCQTVHFGEYWCTELVHFAVLKTNVDVFLNKLSYVGKRY